MFWHLKIAIHYFHPFRYRVNLKLVLFPAGIRTIQSSKVQMPGICPGGVGGGGVGCYELRVDRRITNAENLLKMY